MQNNFSSNLSAIVRLNFVGTKSEKMLGIEANIILGSKILDLPVRDPAVALGIWASGFAEHLNFVRNHETGVEADAELTDDARGFLSATRFLLHLL
jgi:hypothetical protein